jgi:hypothetical protein
MITCTNIGYNGRFGNQLFQFASLIGIAEKLKYEVIFPKENLFSIKNDRTRDGVNHNAYFRILDCFDVPDTYFKNKNEIITRNKVWESHFHFDKSLFEIEDYTDIDGYLQTDKYFNHCENLIRDILKFKPFISEQAKIFLPKTNKEFVSIHVRRTDAAIPNPYHPCMDLDYFNRGIGFFDESKHHFIICSDDYEWCNSIWGNNSNFTIINSGSMYVDLCIMALCENHIISNSSFSWWSSYLSSNKNKKTIAPKNWFGEGFSHYNWNDLYRHDMIVI